MWDNGELKLQICERDSTSYFLWVFCLPSFRGQLAVDVKIAVLEKKKKKKKEEEQNPAWYTCNVDDHFSSFG